MRKIVLTNNTTGIIKASIPDSHMVWGEIKMLANVTRLSPAKIWKKKLQSTAPAIMGPNSSLNIQLSFINLGPIRNQL